MLEQRKATAKRDDAGQRSSFAVRAMAVVLGVVVLLAGGLVHGLWSDRWQPAPDLDHAVARLARVPTTLEGWTSFPESLDPEALNLTGAIGHYSQNFVDAETGERVLVIILCGKPARMSVHRPEDCYRAAGYQILGRPSRVTLTPEDADRAEFWSSLFVRDEATGPEQLRIFWAWLGERWEAPDSPRLQFAGRRVLFKMYVIRNVSGQAGPIDSDPCVRLLAKLLPVLQRTLVPSS